MPYFIYNTLLSLMMPVLLIYFCLKRRSSMNLKAIFQRLGLLNPQLVLSKDRSPRIWIHAASVGEVNAIVSFVKSLRAEFPGSWIGISTMTGSGLEMAKINISCADHHFLSPFDTALAAARYMKMIRPDLYITVETEIWPNLLKYGNRYGARIVMINGRISPNRIGIYKRFRFLFDKALSYYDAFSMILPEDGDRLQAMGASPEKIVINGNMKFDRLSEGINPRYKDEIIKSLNLTGSEKIIVAGSTREGEEELILQAFTKIHQYDPKIILIIAPRHIHRAAEIKRLVARYGFRSILRTEINPKVNIIGNNVIILDTIGELFKVYSLATIVFCGASLVPSGGQNPLEATAWGKVVLYGPSMEDFLDAVALLEKTKSGIMVRDQEELAKIIIYFLNNPKELTLLGEKGRETIISQRGASKRNLEVVKTLMRGKEHGDKIVEEFIS